MVTVVLFLFLWNFRTTFISLTAIPLSLITAIIAMNYFGITVNTMTLGGLAIAIGELVDDAIVDVENVFRRLRQNSHLSTPEPVTTVIFKASSEIRNSIVFATLIIVLVFLPLFSLGSFEGRMFAPLAFAYIISIVASLIVALTVTPVLCYFLLGRSKVIHEEKDSRLVAWLKRHYAGVLNWTLRHPYKIIAGSAAMLLVAVLLTPFMGREFLPPFNEGALNINASLPPGTSLQESNRMGSVIERVLHEVPEVVSTTRRTGRAELDEHAAGVNTSEIEVVTKEGDSPHAEMMEEVRQKLARIPGVDVEVGQPISHRIDHLLSGTRAQIAIKLFGPDLATLRTKAGEIRDAMAGVPGIVDLLVEPQVGVPQVQINMNRQAAAAVGLRAEDLAETVDTAFNGHVASQVLEEQRTYDVLVRFDDSARQSVESIAQHADRHPDGDESPHRAGGRGARRSGAEHNQPRERPAPHHHSGQRRRPGPGERHRRRAQRDRPEGATAARLLRAVRRAVRVAGEGVAADHDSFPRRHRRYLPAALHRPEIRALGPAGDGEFAARFDRRRGDGLPLGRHALRRLARRLHHPVRHRHPQRHHADQPLLAPDGRGGGLFPRRNRAGLDGEVTPDSDDGARHGRRPHPARLGCGRAGQGDSAADGSRHPRRHRHLDLLEHDRHPGALPEVRPGGSPRHRA